MPKLEAIDEQVWCDAHGAIHYKIHDPYGYGYGKNDPDACTRRDWRKLWIGAPVPEKEAVP